MFLLSIIVLACSSEEGTIPPPSNIQTQQPEPETQPEPTTPDPIQYTLTVTAEEGGSVSNDGGTYNEGTTVTITATPQAEYMFTGWSDGNTDATRTVTVDGTKTLIANFEKIKYSLTINIEGVGEVLEEVVNVGRTSDYDSGSIVKLTAVPAEGWEFVGWTGALESTELEVQLLINLSTTLLAKFTLSTSGTSSPIEMCELENYHVDRKVSLGFPRYDYSLKSNGNLKTALIFIDFNDAPATRNINEVYEILSPSSNDFFSKSSYGKLSMEFEVINQWYRMSKNSNQYSYLSDGEAHYNYLSEALSLADTDYDFSQVDNFVVITNPDANNFNFGPAFIGDDYWNFKADGKTFYTSTNSASDLDNWGGLWLNHEVLHNMGLPDLYRYGGSYESEPFIHGFVGEFSIMGLISGAAPDLFGYEKWMLGWIDNASIFCKTVGESIINITPVESYEDGTKIIILPISNKISLVLESRRAINLDQNIPDEGLLIYKIDTSILNGEGTIEVLPQNRNDMRKFSNLLKQGDTFSFDNYQIEVLLQNENYDRVRIIKN